MCFQYSVKFSTTSEVVDSYTKKAEYNALKLES